MSAQPNNLRRILSLPLLVFYGVGVTVGAGIFTLISEITRLAGDHTYFSFIVAGIIAAFTSGAYAILANAYPRAAGEAIFVKYGIGVRAGHLVGYGVVAVAITTAAVISIGVAGYVQNLIGIPEPISILTLLAMLSAIASIGVKESVIFAAVITLLEVGTLLIIIFVGIPFAIESPRISEVMSWPIGWPEWSAIFSGSFLAFFAFIGFEDIENLAEETQDAQKAIPIAIVLTLLISVSIYALIAIIAASWPDREMLVTSHAPLADLFEQASGYNGAVISVLASIAMTNGILIQIIMASRVLYGMANEGMAPIWFKGLHHKRQTPDRAILFVGSISAILALSFPIVQIAEFTSMVVLCIFAAVNLSLFRIGSRSGSLPRIRRWRYFGLIGAIFSVGLIYFSGIK